MEQCPQTTHEQKDTGIPMSRTEKFQSIYKKLNEIERPMNELETGIVSEADRRTSVLLNMYGIPSSNIRPDTIHIIPQSEWPGGHAFMKEETKEVIIVEQENYGKFALEVVHEMLHVKGSNILPTPLTEAIVERLTNQAMNLSDPSLVGGQVFSGTYAYPQYRKVFDALLSKISLHSQEETADRLGIFSFFAKAHLSGDMRFLLFLDNLFGAGTADRLNNLSDDTEALEKFIEALGDKF